MLGRGGGPIPDLVRNNCGAPPPPAAVCAVAITGSNISVGCKAQLGTERNLTDPTFRANNPQMGDDFAAVYEATAHRITGPVSNTALDIVGVGPGTRIVDIAAGAGR